MLQSEQIEELVCLVSAMDREGLVQQFQNYQSRFPVDFTPEFLANTSLDRLRHIFVALCLQNQTVPALETADASPSKSPDQC